MSNFFATAHIGDRTFPNCGLIIAQDLEIAMEYRTRLIDLGAMEFNSNWIFVDQLEGVTFNGIVHGFFVGEWWKNPKIYEHKKVLRQLGNKEISYRLEILESP